MINGYEYSANLLIQKFFFIFFGLVMTCVCLVIFQKPWKTFQKVNIKNESR